MKAGIAVIKLFAIVFGFIILSTFCLRGFNRPWFPGQAYLALLAVIALAIVAWRLLSKVVESIYGEEKNGN